MKNILVSLIVLCASMIFLSVHSDSATASVINFESIPGIEVPTDGLLINNQFETTHGVIFSLEGGGSPQLARIGAPTTAFQGPIAGDTPVPGQGIGEFFLTDDGILSGLAAIPLIVTYTTPTAAASGIILDIDFDESFLIEARNNIGDVIESIVINAGDPGTGDGIATLWSFTRPSADVYSIRFVGSRSTSGSFGLGFDNFDARSASAATPIPLPATHILMLAGLIGFLFFTRQKLIV